MEALRLLPLIAALIAWPVEAQQQPGCFLREEVVITLDQQFDAAMIGIGMHASGGVYEVWVSRKPPAQWVIMMTRPDGVTCIMSAGPRWIGPGPASEPEGEDG